MAKKSRKDLYKIKKKEPPKKVVEPVPKQSQNNWGKQFLLLVGTIFLLSGFFFAEKNRTWVEDRILKYYNSIDDQIDQLDTEHRSGLRNQYVRNLSAFLCEKLGAEDTLMFPPKELIRNAKVVQENSYLNLWLTPSVMYYYCDSLHIVSWDMPAEIRNRANFCLLLNDNDDISLLEIRNENIRENILKRYQEMVDNGSSN